MNTLNYLSRMTPSQRETLQYLSEHSHAVTYNVRYGIAYAGVLYDWDGHKRGRCYEIGKRGRVRVGPFVDWEYFLT